jgi:DNA-binding transcriptional MerR regulator
MNGHADAFRTISEVAEDLDLPQHVLRFWETRFTQIRPLKRGGGRRYYRPEDVELLRAIRHLLYGEGYTIRGVQRILKEQGVKAVVSLRPEGAALSSPRPSVPRDEEGEGEPDFAEDGLDSGQIAPIDVARLHHALAELAECTRILEAARAS